LFFFCALKFFSYYLQSYFVEDKFETCSQSHPDPQLRTDDGKRRIGVCADVATELGLWLGIGLRLRLGLEIWLGDV